MPRIEATVIAKAFRERRPKSMKRTKTDGSSVYLCGNRIATRDDDSGMIWLTMAGWDTVTTRDRLNAICDAFGIEERFRQHEREQFFGQRMINAWEHIPLAGPLTMLAWEAERRASLTTTTTG